MSTNTDVLPTIHEHWIIVGYEILKFPSVHVVDHVEFNMYM